MKEKSLNTRYINTKEEISRSKKNHRSTNSILTVISNSSNNSTSSSLDAVVLENKAINSCTTIFRLHSMDNY